MTKRNIMHHEGSRLRKPAARSFGDLLSDIISSEFFVRLPGDPRIVQLAGSLMGDERPSGFSAPGDPRVVVWPAGDDPAGRSPGAREGRASPRSDPAFLLPAVYAATVTATTHGRSIVVPHPCDERTDEELLRLSGCGGVVRPNEGDDRDAALGLIDALASADFVFTACLEAAAIAAAYRRPFAYWRSRQGDPSGGWADFSDLLAIPHAFHERLDEGRAFYREHVASVIKPPKLLPLLAAAPLPLHPDAVLKVLAYESTGSTRAIAEPDLARILEALAAHRGRVAESTAGIADALRSRSGLGDEPPALRDARAGDSSDPQAELARMEETLRERDTQLADAKEQYRVLNAYTYELGVAFENLSQEKARLHESLSAVYRSTSWRAAAPLRLSRRAAGLLKRGAVAWLLFKPGSRPRRILDRVRGRAASAPDSSTTDVSIGPRFPNEPASVALYAERLIHVGDGLRKSAGDRQPPRRQNDDRPRLAFVSPLPPERTGIADYSAELLPYLARHYEIDVVVDQSQVSDPWIAKNLTVRSTRWFEDNAHRYDRIVYHVGNSVYHRDALRLLRLYPGVVVLHDFFIGHLLAGLEIDAGWTGYWTRALGDAHGYDAVRDRHAPGNIHEAIQAYPANLFITQQAQGIIVHGEFSRELSRRFYGDGWADDWAVIPHLRRLPELGDRAASRARLGFKRDDFVICSFGILGDTKQNRRLLETWLASNLALRPDCHLVFVGEPQPDAYCSDLKARIDALPFKDRVRITGFAEFHLYRLYLNAADAAVQLRALSRGETSGTVLDCMAHKIPTIVNANGSMGSLPDDCVVMLPDRFEDGQLREALEAIHGDAGRRAALGERARRFVGEHLEPGRIADLYRDAIEGFAQRAPAPMQMPALVELVAGRESLPPDDADLLDLARELARRSPVKRPYRQLLVDISVLARADYKTGIQRVVRAQLLALLEQPPSGYRVEPVQLVEAEGRWQYRYARRYLMTLLGIEGDVLPDEPAEALEGDVLFVADYFTDGTLHAARDGVYETWRERGVSINFLVYDVLPLTAPHRFPDFAPGMHAAWLGTAADWSDTLVCISQATADGVRGWLEVHRPAALARLKIAPVHLGADLKASAPSKGQPVDAPAILSWITERPSFLMVGTIEPRKGHLQTLAAFERLWADGVDVNLVVVGSEGWKAVPEDQRRTIPQIVEALRESPERGRRLIWLEAASDEFLERIYAASACLIAASEDEGFGLPLIEAASHEVPLLIRDIPVFREVAGEHAFYFAGETASDLADAVRQWLSLRERGTHPRSGGMPWITWAESVGRLKDVLGLATPAAPDRVGGGCAPTPAPSDEGSSARGSDA